MPELPEVEHAAARLRQVALGAVITGTRVRHPALARAFPPDAQGAVAGEAIIQVARRGKVQLVTLSGGGTLEVHFRLAGDWAFGGGRTPRPPMSAYGWNWTGGAGWR